MTNAWLYAILAVSLTLVAGTSGQISLGHAGLLAIGGYASALLSLDQGMPVPLAILLAGVIAAALGTLLVYPSFRLRGHYVSVATLAVGEIVSLVILNWTSLTHGPIGVPGIPPLTFFGLPLYSAEANPVVDGMALDAIAAITRALPRVSADPHDPQARADLLQAAWLAGTCLAGVGMGLHHKLCHTLGGSFDLPHAPTHTVVLPHA